MNKTKLIIEREYLTRVRKKAFIIMTFLGPILFAALFAVPVWLKSIDSEEVRRIAVIDKEGSFGTMLKDNENVKFEIQQKGITNKSLRDKTGENGYYAILNIPKNISKENNNISIYSSSQVNISTKSYIKSVIEKELENRMLKEQGISPEVIERTKVDINIATKQWTEEGEARDSSFELSMIVGIIVSLTIYMFIFIYGAQVMRGVIEEKTNRIIEVLISSVKPFELMMGKIIGIALVVITQILLWIALTTVIMWALQPLLLNGMSAREVSDAIEAGSQLTDEANAQIASAFNSIFNLPLITILFSFIVYFLGGYLLYASLFAAIGAAVDNEADTQQFMMPVTIPLILAMLVAEMIIKQPDGSVAFWFSMIPLTSPIVMIIRIPFGEVPAWELITSMLLLIGSFIFTTWLAAKIYRVGILMYGKKPSYKELWKWLKY